MRAPVLPGSISWSLWGVSTEVGETITPAQLGLQICSLHPRLDSCQLTSTCCPDLATALTSCKTLQRLNLCAIRLDLSRAKLLFVALSDANCHLQILG